MSEYPYSSVIFCTWGDRPPLLDGETYEYIGETTGPETGYSTAGEEINIPVGTPYGVFHPSEVRVYWYCVDSGGGSGDVGGGGGSGSSGSGGGSGKSGSNVSNSSGSNGSNGSNGSSLSNSSGSNKAIFNLGSECVAVVCVESPEQRLCFRQFIPGSCFVTLPKVFDALCEDIIVSAARDCFIAKISPCCFYFETERPQHIEFTGKVKNTVSFRKSNEEEFNRQKEHYLKIS